MRLDETNTLTPIPCLYRVLIKSYTKKRRSLAASQGQYTFLCITFYQNTIETWDRRQRVRLVKTHLMIGDMTYFSQYVTLALGDLRSKLLQKVTKLPSDIRRCALTRRTLWHQPHVSSSFLSKVIGKKRTATRRRHNVTSDDLSTGNDATARRGYQA